MDGELKFDKALHNVRVYVLGAFLWRVGREKKARDAYHLRLAYRFKLVAYDGKLTPRGCAFAKRHEDRFLALEKPHGKKKEDSNADQG